MFHANHENHAHTLTSGCMGERLGQGASVHTIKAAGLAAIHVQEQRLRGGKEASLAPNIHFKNYQYVSIYFTRQLEVFHNNGSSHVAHVFGFFMVS